MVLLSPSSAARSNNSRHPPMERVNTPQPDYEDSADSGIHGVDGSIPDYERVGTSSCKDCAAGKCHTKFIHLPARRNQKKRRKIAAGIEAGSHLFDPAGTIFVRSEDEVVAASVKERRQAKAPQVPPPTGRSDQSLKRPTLRETFTEDKSFVIRFQGHNDRWDRGSEERSKGCGIKETT
ncbi:hypothetical protein ACOMHN_036279 [Nucella lapillus]